MNLNRRLIPLFKIHKRPVIAIAILSLIGLADASYLTASHYLSFSVPCSLTAGCETVLKSSYATIGTIPVALLGVLYYLTALIITVSIITSNSEIYSQKTEKFLLGLFSLGLLASGYFVYLQIFVIHALCLYCLTSAFLSLLLFISIFLLVKRKKVIQQ